MIANTSKQTQHELDRRVEHLLLSTQLEESGTSKFIIYSIFLICATILYLIIWASFTELEEITIADGTIVPKSSIRNLQHLEGGIISEIYFKNGDRVQKDDVIMKLAPEPATSDLQRYKSQQNTMNINIARLEAFISGKEITYDYLLSKLKYPGVDEPASIHALITYSLSYLKQQILSFQNEKDIILSQINKLELNLKNYDQQIELLESRIALVEDQNKMYVTLNAEQGISKITLLDNTESLKEKKGQLLELNRSRLEAANSLTEYQERLDNLSIDFKAKSLDELTKLTSDSIENDIAVKKAADRVARLTVKAPAYGIINGLELKPGSVIPPGQPLFELVPLEGGLIGSVKISTKDIGHVSMDDLVKIKVTSFDFAIYGKLTGKISKISASTFSEQGKDPYYKATIDLDKTYLGNDENLNKVVPGMTITAEIVTNKKSVISYLLKPIRRSLGSAMRER